MQIAIRQFASVAPKQLEPDPNFLRNEPRSECSTDDPARDMDVVGIDQKREVFRYADGRSHVERCTGLGQVSDGAVDGSASKL
jgi:hypothetical protein